MSTWYPPTTYEPACGTGQLLVNPPFDAMTDPDLIETACHNACQAMHHETRRAIAAQRTPEPSLIRAAALATMRREGITGDDLPACIDRLRRSAAPGRVE